MESVNVLVSEKAQQDMDLKSAFVLAVPRQPFFRPAPRPPPKSWRCSRQTEGAPDPSAQSPNWPASEEKMADATRTAEGCLQPAQRER